MAVGVSGELLLVPLELLPVDVAIMMILQQYLTVLKRTVVAVGLARPPINNLGSIDAFAVGIDTGIKGVLQHRNDIAVSDRRPIERRHPLAVGGAWEMYLLGLEREMNLSGAAKFSEALENPAGDFLYAVIRIEAETDLPMPDIANRHGNSEFTSSGFGP